MSEVEEKMERLEARVPARLKKMFVKASRLEGQSLTDFLIKTATEAARKVIHEHEILELSKRDQLAFANAMLDAPKPTPALKAAAKRYRRTGSD